VASDEGQPGRLDHVLDVGRRQPEPASDATQHPVEALNERGPRARVPQCRLAGEHGEIAARASSGGARRVCSLEHRVLLDRCAAGAPPSVVCGAASERFHGPPRRLQRGCNRVAPGHTSPDAPVV